MKTRSKTATSFLKLPDITIGTDLGDKSHAICVMSAAGEIIEERKSATIAIHCIKSQISIVPRVLPWRLVRINEKPPARGSRPSGSPLLRPKHLRPSVFLPMD